jgi:uncharacterized protein YqhQ
MLTLGGQAVIEGVMVRSPRFVAVAVRTPQGDCEVQTRPAPSMLLSKRGLRRPFVRGIVALGEGLSIGTWALLASAQAARQSEPALTPGKIRLIMARSFTIAIVAFFLLPAALTRALGGVVPSPLGQNLVEGGLRIAFVLGFLAAIGRIPAIHRVFQYHGAEHKAVHAYEAGVVLDIDSARRESIFHDRCGTTFLLIVLLVAIVIFALFGHPSLAVRLAERVSLLPVVAAASYELMRLAQRSPRFRVLIVPGLWLQRLTTREPDDRQLGVALAAVNGVLAREAELSQEHTIASGVTLPVGG